MKTRNNSTFYLGLTNVCVSLFDEILPFFTDVHEEYFRWQYVKSRKLARLRSLVIQSNIPLSTVADRLSFNIQLTFSATTMIPIDYVA